MKKLFVALLIFFSSFTNGNFSYSFSNLSQKISNNTVELLHAIETRSVGYSYLKNNFQIETNNIPVSMPLDINGFERISEYYGIRKKHPILKVSSFHNGIDFSGKYGTDIFAAADGIVIKVKRILGYGKLVIVDHGNGIVTYYAHLSKYNVKEGQVVKAGEKIAELGSTGWSTGPHLHFEIRVNNKAINPTLLLFKEDIRDEKEIISKLTNQTKYYVKSKYNPCS